MIYDGKACALVPLYYFVQDGSALESEDHRRNYYYFDKEQNIYKKLPQSYACEFLQ